MANRRFYQFTFSLNPALTYIQGSFQVGSAGAVSNVKGSGIKNVEHLATGIYRVDFTDEYNRYLQGTVGLVAPLAGAIKYANTVVTGTAYVITNPGNTNWNAIGLPAGVVAAQGMSFVATGTTAAGTGSCYGIGTTGIFVTEMMGDPNPSIGQAVAPYVMFQFLNAAGSQTDPASGSTVGFDAMLRNSSVKGKGE